MTSPECLSLSLKITNFWLKAFVTNWLSGAKKKKKRGLSPFFFFFFFFFFGFKICWSWRHNYASNEGPSGSLNSAWMPHPHQTSLMSDSATFQKQKSDNYAIFICRLVWKSVWFGFLNSCKTMTVNAFEVSVQSYILLFCSIFCLTLLPLDTSGTFLYR